MWGTKTPTASEDYILGNSEATSMILPLWVPSLAALLFVLHIDDFMSPSCSRTIILGSPFA